MTQELAHPADPAVPAKPLYDTALFATVLHHEPDPSALIEKVLATARPTRLAVVENCLSATVSNEFHDFMDSFFNLASTTSTWTARASTARSRDGWSSSGSTVTPVWCTSSQT
ncbi:hypothetical protein C3492_36215 [Streptomyces sp. Ru62]|nr:hypothetical protein C3492_36215 [Streptomyces sp. Ru62]